jgi:hypothetical protein
MEVLPNVRPFFYRPIYNVAYGYVEMHGCQESKYGTSQNARRFEYHCFSTGSRSHTLTKKYNLVLRCLDQSQTLNV